MRKCFRSNNTLGRSDNSVIIIIIFYTGRERVNESIVFLYTFLAELDYVVCFIPKSDVLDQAICIPSDNARFLIPAVVVNLEQMFVQEDLDYIVVIPGQVL